MAAERESKIEKDCVIWAKARGWFEFKIMKANKRGLPDRFFARLKNGVRRVVFIEFKRDGKESCAQQELRQAELRAQGVEVYEIDSREEFYACMA